MISEQDKKAWQEAIQNVKPISKSDQVINTKPDTSNTITDEWLEFKEPSDKMPIISNETGNGPIEKKLSKTLRSGGFNYNVSIDYHGWTVDEAFSKFIRDIKLNYCQNHRRSLLIVTGKSGTMYNEFKQWCQHKSIRKFIWYVCPAHPKHGGDGAWYIILQKRNR